MKYKTKQKLETLVFFTIIVASIFAMVTLLSYGNEWANEVAKHLIGITHG